MGIFFTQGGSGNKKTNIYKAERKAGQHDGEGLENIQSDVGGKQGRPVGAGIDRSQSDAPSPGHGDAQGTHRRVLTDFQIKVCEK